MIHVALAANSKYFDGLAATLLSLLYSNRGHTFTVSIIDGGLSPAQKQFLTKRTTASNTSNHISFHVIDARVFAGFTPDYGNSYMTYARTVIGSLLTTERVIYLDTDLLIAADLLPLWNTDVTHHIAAAAPDQGIPFLKDDYPFDDDCGAERYFNAGVMLINLNRWRAVGVQKSLLQMIAEGPARFKWWDQTAMNAIFRGQVLFLEARWNMFADRMEVRPPDRDFIYHYVGPTKPWMRHLYSTEFRVWRAFFRRHVRPAWVFFRDARYVKSFLQEARYRMLQGSWLPRGLAAARVRENIHRSTPCRVLRSNRTSVVAGVEV